MRQGDVLDLALATQEAVERGNVIMIRDSQFFAGLSRDELLQHVIYVEQKPGARDAKQLHAWVYEEIDNEAEIKRRLREAVNTIEFCLTALKDKDVAQCITEGLIAHIWHVNGVYYYDDIEMGPVGRLSNLAYNYELGLHDKTW